MQRDFRIPILLITYKRIDTTLKVLEQIKKVNAKKLYISSNCWKNNEEKQQVLTTRKKIQDFIDWDCEVIFFIREKHLSAKQSGSSAISDFFKLEELGVILEDDCVPTQSFFYFCEEMLERYKNQKEIFMISGWSALDFAPKAKQTLKEDYYFSKYNHIWGWASWRRAWELYQKEFFDFEQEFQSLSFDSKSEKKCWHHIFKLYSEGRFDAWDYPWTHTLWKHKALSIYPKDNMIANIGLNRSDASNTKTESKFEGMKTYDLNFPLKHPQKIERNIALDQIDFKICFKPNPFLVIVINKLSRILTGKNIIRV